MDAGLWQKIGGKSFALQHECVLALKNAKCNNIKDNEDTPASRKLMFLFFLPKAKNEAYSEDLKASSFFSVVTTSFFGFFPVLVE